MIKKYIQLAIDNGYEGIFYECNMDNYDIEVDIDVSVEEQRYRGKDTDGITIVGNFIKRKSDEDNYNVYYPLYEIIQDRYFLSMVAKGIQEYKGCSNKEFILNELLIEQAIAISKGELELYIKNILQNEKSNNKKLS